MKSLVYKILSGVGALFVISIFTFLLIKASSSNPAENYLRVSKIPITPESVAKATEYLGLNLSLPEQYAKWLGNLLQGNFGISYLYKTDVLPLVWQAFLSTLQLGSAAFFIVLVGSLFFGLLSAVYRTTWLDTLIRICAYINVSIPTFFLGYVLMIIFGVQLKILPVSGKDSPLSIILPSVTLAFPLLAQYTVFIRQHAIEQLESIHVENARIRGVKMNYILSNHVLKNMLPAMVSGYCMTFAYLITGSLIIEEVFAWRGIGYLFVSAVKAVDVPVIQLCMLVFGALFLIINSCMRQLTLWVNPLERKKG